MFGKRDNGEKAFKACDVKVVEYKDFVYTDESETEIVLSENCAEDPRSVAGVLAVLHCPRTEDDRVRIETVFDQDVIEENAQEGRIDAYNQLRKIAGTVLCAECRFSNMSPVEVSIARTELARAEAFVARERAMQELRGLQQDAAAELRAINPPQADGI